MRPETQAIAMIDALLKNCGELDLGVIKNIGRPDENPMFPRPLPTDYTKLMSWARWQNAQKNANIYIRPSPREPHPWLFLDDVPTAIAHGIAGKYAALIVETSPRNCQIRLLADRSLTTPERFAVQSQLVTLLAGNADPASTAGDKWGRLPGFRNKKPGRDCWTDFINDSTSRARRFDPAHLLAGGVKQHSSPAVGVPSSPQGGGVVSLGCGGGSESEREFAFACHSLRRGEQDESIINKITDRAVARDKRKTVAEARRYAELTVSNARKNLW